MRIGLIGSSGMIGRHMKEVLQLEGIDHCSIGRKEWDLQNWKTHAELDELFDRCDAVFHFAAALPEGKKIQNYDNSSIQQCFDVNVRSCLNLAEWASRKKIPLIFLSGSTVYEDVYAKSIQETSPKVTNGFGGIYGYTKLLAEHVFNHFSFEDLKVIILRPSSVYGVGLGKDKMICKFLDDAANNRVIEIDGPYNRVNLIHAGDVARAALQAFRSQAWGTYNVAASNLTSIKELAEICIDIYGKGKIEIKENSLAPFCRFDLDVCKASHAFNYNAMISVENGLELMVKQRELL